MIESEFNYVHISSFTKHKYNMTIFVNIMHIRQQNLIPNHKTQTEKKQAMTKQNMAQKNNKQHIANK